MKRKHFLMSTAVAMMIAGGAVAQDTATPETGTATTGADTAVVEPMFTSLGDMTVADMIGMFAYDPEGERISEVDYVIMGANGPEVVLGIGGFLGLGEYTVALPLTEFELGDDGATLRLGTDKETLKTYPEFDESTAENLPGETSIGSLLAQAEGGASGDATMTEESATTTEEGAADTVTDEAATEESSETEEGAATEEGAMSEEGEATGEATTEEGTTTQ
ncbi:hypothetical protein GCM10016455_24120 [Aliiroseovarius zhejiangensis]|uniref:PRC-barrel domain-containing protein n=1 Tax=Aliiroseovarius zhejiangensis TaxID=1632025 RepID=A0ABQ3J2J1_9RHOB|nr:hypothetical protein [Aliiroseovarius zhejiangensis]GHF02205.1 hypothetical protein GCM10016455_24120 [Aliiroseovarius zhejiangensis]